MKCRPNLSIYAGFIIFISEKLLNQFQQHIFAYDTLWLDLTLIQIKSISDSGYYDINNWFQILIHC